MMMNYSTALPHPHRFTLTEWQKMGQYEIFESSTRLELLEGEMIDMVPIGPSHSGCVKTLIRLLSKQLGDTALLSVQDPIQLGNNSEPQPDVAILRFVSHCYRERHPTAEDVLLLIEVADSSVTYDRNKKIPLYAQAGIVECWLINVLGRQIEVYLKPSPEGYSEKRVVRPGTILTPSQLPQINIAVSDILD